MPVSALGLVAQNEIVNPGHGLTGGADSIDLTMPTISPAVAGDGAVLVVYLIMGWIDTAFQFAPTGPVGLKDGTVAMSDDVVNPLIGSPKNSYSVVLSPSFAQFTQIYSDETQYGGGGPYTTQGGQFIQIEEVDATWGFVSGDTITVQLSDTYDYIAAYAFLFRGSGVIPAYLGGGPQVAIPAGGHQALALVGGGEVGEEVIDATYAGSIFNGLTYGDYGFVSNDKLLALTIIEGGGFLIGGEGPGQWVKPGTVVGDTDDILDDLGVWTPEVFKQIAAGDCNINTGFIYRLWSQTYPGAAQNGVTIAEFESSPSRRVSDLDGIFSPAAGMFWVQILDLFVSPQGRPIFNNSARRQTRRVAAA